MKGVWKNRGKLSLALLLCCLCFTLTACDPATFRYDYQELSAEAVSVELIEYYNGAPQFHNEFLFKSRKGIIAFDADKAELDETLAPEKIDGFLRELSDVDFLQVWNHGDTPIGMCIRIVYSNGNYDVMCGSAAEGGYYGFLGRYKADGKPIEFVGTLYYPRDFWGMVNQYFQTQVDETGTRENEATVIKPDK